LFVREFSIRKVITGNDIAVSGKFLAFNYL
jgi:hypothetical protein